MSEPNSAFQPPPPPYSTTVVREYPRGVRISGIVLTVLGLIIVIAGIARVLPGGASTGASMCVLGLILLGLSFIPSPQPKPDEPPPMSALQRILGVFYEPTAVFRNLRAHPRWLAGLLLIAVLNVAYVFAFTQRLTPERIVNFTVDKMAETPFIPPEAVEKARDQGLQDAKSPPQRVGNAIKGLVWSFILFIFVGALYLVGVLIFGGRMNFWQALAVAVYAALPAVVITKVVSFILLYLKSPDDIHPLRGQETLLQDNLGILFEPKEHPVLFVAAASIGVLSFYKLWLSAKGLHEGGDRVSSTAGWGVAIVIWVIGLIFGLTITAIFPSFIS
jgi:hypothetical protein